MCRIAIMNAPAVLDIRTRELLAALEQSQGGHGNGVWSTRHNVVLKSAEMSTDFAAGYLDKAAKLDASPHHVLVFHTRIASAGGIDSRTNHPFRVGDDSVLVHNGTMAMGDYTQLGALSDTAAVACAIREKGIAPVFGSRMLEDGGVFVVAVRLEKLTRLHIRVGSSQWPQIFLHTWDDEKFALISEDKRGKMGIPASAKVRRLQKGYWTFEIHESGKTRFAVERTDGTLMWDDIDGCDPDLLMFSKSDEDDEQAIDDAILESASGLSGASLDEAYNRVGDADYRLWLELINAYSYDACSMCPLSQCDTDCNVYQMIAGGASD